MKWNFEIEFLGSSISKYPIVQKRQRIRTVFFYELCLSFASTIMRKSRRRRSWQDTFYDTRDWGTETHRRVLTARFAMKLRQQKESC